MGINAAMLFDQYCAVKELSRAVSRALLKWLRRRRTGHADYGVMICFNEIGLCFSAWHALRIVNVADGTNEILNRTIAQQFLKGDVGS